MDDLYVLVQCYNGHAYERLIPLTKYTNTCSAALKEAIGHVESEFIRSIGPKDEWSPETQKAFKSFRKCILDAANDVERIPKDICHKVSENNLSEVLEAIEN